ncbi:hypothetical protein HFP89_00775 [Wenzhouxiangella sp. XN79A]|uniref:ABC-type transport auxiliary lipoprotein family protein n=1 Tax=Wenzhouxiangella sp. XN79A TaxID=2724193 RepID=UPI00144A9DF2|nr:ABC-type transport auxiliary lipoprotein family protein [Wenzhouxiangella sp. XN79A]NKI33697.1 hypothetical protein [Wenzhouxiangella sp. XN79A]
MIRSVPKAVRLNSLPLLIAALAVSLGLAGCSVLPEKVAVQQLDPRIDGVPGAHGPTRPGRLGLPRPEADPARDANRVLVRTAGGRLQVLPQLRWVAPAPDLLQTTLIRYLRDAELFSDVTPSASLVDRALFIDLRRFELAETDDGLAAVIELDARLLDADSGAPVARLRMLHQAPLASAGATEVVAGFEAALADLAGRIADRLADRTADRSTANPPSD